MSTIWKIIKMKTIQMGGFSWVIIIKGNAVLMYHLLFQVGTEDNVLDSIIHTHSW